MSEWTDVDYAQAAIDMLPESVEEIRGFLKRQGVKNSRIRTSDIGRTCPIAQWVSKWTDYSIAGVGYRSINVHSGTVLLTRPAEEFILKYGEGL